MTFTEKLMGVGAWDLRLDPATPGEIRDRMLVRNAGRGHVVITPVWADLGAMSDEDALGFARFVGIYLARDESGLGLSGCHVNGWLGTDDLGPSTGGTGDTAQTFAEWAARCRPSPLGIGAGVTSSIAGTWAKQFGLSILRTVADGVAARFNAAWRITNQLDLDFGTYADLFRTVPVALIVRHREDAGRDLGVRGITGDLNMVRDIEDTPRRVIYRWDDDGTPADVIQAGGVADVDYPFRGPTGLPMFVDKVIEDTQTTELADATALSAAQLGRVAGVRQEITLSSSEYDVGADITVGDNVHAFDLERGLYDLGNPVTYRGQTIYPEVIRCVGYTAPIRQGMGVWFRRYRRVDDTWVLEWTDLTPYVMWESGDTTVEVGAKPRTRL